MSSKTKRGNSKNIYLSVRFTTHKNTIDFFIQILKKIFFFAQPSLTSRVVFDELSASANAFTETIKDRYRRLP